MAFSLLCLLAIWVSSVDAGELRLDNFSESQFCVASFPGSRCLTDEPFLLERNNRFQNETMLPMKLSRHVFASLISTTNYVEKKAFAEINIEYEVGMGTRHFWWMGTTCESEAIWIGTRSIYSSWIGAERLVEKLWIGATVMKEFGQCRNEFAVEICFSCSQHVQMVQHRFYGTSSNGNGSFSHGFFLRNMSCQVEWSSTSPSSLIVWSDLSSSSMHRWFPVNLDQFLLRSMVILMLCMVLVVFFMDVSCISGNRYCNQRLGLGRERTNGIQFKKRRCRCCRLMHYKQHKLRRTLFCLVLVVSQTRVRSMDAQAVWNIHGCYSYNGAKECNFFRFNCASPSEFGFSTCNFRTSSKLRISQSSSEESRDV